jgi:spore germination protein KC
MTEEEIASRITHSFETARAMGADIYGFGELVHEKPRDEWKTMSGNWEELFSDCELEVKVKATIPATGQIVQSINMRGAGQ